MTNEELEKALGFVKEGGKFFHKESWDLGYANAYGYSRERMKMFEEGAAILLHPGVITGDPECRYDVEEINHALKLLKEAMEMK